ncbi:hypothetical protein QQF64_003377 [Cirrhinus molitorella]|uniref:Uncharacterized protein n=1 Tax=Cirrhinus molitorella TaxID=172907 RepID=A0ABR3ML45_9TELE
MHLFNSFVENALKCRVRPDTFPLKIPRFLNLYNPGVGGSSHVVLQPSIKTFQRLKSGTMSVRTRNKPKLPNTHTESYDEEVYGERTLEVKMSNKGGHDLHLKN